MKIRTYRALSMVVCQQRETRRPPIDIIYLRLGTGKKAAVLIEL